MRGLIGSVLYGEDQRVGELVHKLMHRPAPKAGSYTALGFVREGELLGGVVFSNYRRHDVEISIAVRTPKAVTADAIRQVSAYVFDQLGCKRVTALTSRKNKRARSGLERLGFKLEGVARKGFDGTTDAMIYGLLREEYRFGVTTNAGS